MTEFQIRPASTEDCARLVEFNCAMAYETENIQLDADVVAAGVRALFERPERGFYVVAETHGILAGSLMITTEWSDWRNGMFWWIQSVYVQPEHRRRGVYRALYRYARAMSAEREEVCGFRLYVERDNRRAQQTYESLGMTRTPYIVYEALSRDADPGETS